MNLRLIVTLVAVLFFAGEVRPVGASNLHFFNTRKANSPPNAATTGDSKSVVSNFNKPQLDKTPPTVVSVTPPNGSKVAVSDPDTPIAPITVTFSKPMDPDSVTNSISLWGVSLILAEIPVTVVPALEPKGLKYKKYTIIPNLPNETLSAGAGYVVKLKKGVPKDVNGNALADEYSWNFFAEDYPCLEPEFTLNVTGSCTHHIACSSWDRLWTTCDDFYNPGDIVITDSLYTLDWSTKNVTTLVDSCSYMNVDQEINFDGDSGEVQHPLPVVLGEDAEYQRENAPKADLYLPPGATTKGPIKYNCEVTAYGACGKKVSVNYSISCP